MQLDPHTALRTTQQLGRERRSLARDHRLGRALRAASSNVVPAPAPMRRTRGTPSWRARVARVVLHT